MGGTESKFIPYNDLYGEFLNSKCMINMIPDNFEYNVFQLQIDFDEEYIGNYLEDLLVQSENVFILLMYPHDIMYHVTGILRRNNKVEYIDGMIGELQPPWDMGIENILDNICEYHQWTFISSEKMYGGLVYSEEYGQQVYKRNALKF